ncbi:MAG TPA: hypothetical protein VG709_01300, partial [Actinomycetota bacterium]|nr:hypothetical protein [Actinomycetota bacterium]
MAAWTSLEGSLASAPAAVSWGDGEVEVFAIQDDGALWNRYWDLQSWHAWESLGGSFRGEPAASARDANRIDVLAIGTDGALRHRFWNGSQWVPWREIADAPRDAKAGACSWRGARLD